MYPYALLYKYKKENLDSMSQKRTIVGVPYRMSQLMFAERD